MSNYIKPHTPISQDIQNIVAKHRHSKDLILEILAELQNQTGYLTEQKITDVARALQIPPHKVFGMATFYSMLSTTPKKKDVIRVCDSPVCWMKGSQTLLESLQQEQKHWAVERSSCLGLCDHAPAILVNTQQAGPVPIDTNLESACHEPLHPIDYSKPRPGELRVMLNGIGEIDPNSLSSALEAGAYRALKKAIEQSPDEIIDEVENSGLTGRGGAGFPVGRKWRFVSQATAQPKYIICNADESEPLIFKDRILISTNPHQLLEGMIIAGYATGAEEGFIYIRGEYEQQAALLENAINQAEEASLIGGKILGTDFNFHIHIHRGAGAYICGEETALIESLEGKRGEPRLRPPYPPTYGLYGKPTLVNNVESFSAVPAIVLNGADWYKSLSEWRTPGTKLFMVLGRVQSPGIFEAPFGITLRQVLENFAGGMLPGSKFHFALTGGAAGTIVSEDFMDIPIDYQSVRDGISLGAGAFLIGDQNDSPVELLQNLLHFFKVESCGKCTPCRVGTHRGFEILSAILDGKGQATSLDELEELAEFIHDASFCGLGQSVSLPITSALKNFRNEFTFLTGKSPVN